MRARLICKAALENVLGGCRVTTQWLKLDKLRLDDIENCPQDIAVRKVGSAELRKQGMPSYPACGRRNTPIFFIKLGESHPHGN